MTNYNHTSKNSIRYFPSLGLALLVFMLISPQTHGQINDQVNDQINDQIQDADKSQGESMLGKIVFLELPFKSQEKGGICAGSSLLNIVEYMGTPFKLSQREFFTLFDAGRSGANLSEMSLGLQNIGYTIEVLYHKGRDGRIDREEKENLKNLIISKIDQKMPLSVASPGHAFTLVGYNMENETFYIWDQGKANDNSLSTKVTIPNVQVPSGASEIKMDRVTSRLQKISYIIPSNGSQILEYDIAGVKQSLEQAELYQEVLRNGNKHKIYKFEDKREISQKRFIRKVAPILIGGLLKNNHRVLVTIPDPKNGKEANTTKQIFIAYAISNDSKDSKDSNNPNTSKILVSGTMLPDYKDITIKMDELSDYIMEDSNTYYSIATE